MGSGIERREKMTGEEQKKLAEKKQILRSKSTAYLISLRDATCDNASHYRWHLRHGFHGFEPGLVSDWLTNCAVKSILRDRARG